MYKLHQLTYIKNNTITGAMAPVEAAKEFCKLMGTKFHNLIRVSFDNPEVNNIYEHVTPKGNFKSELTGMDTLIYVRYYKNATEAGMFVDEGSRFCGVAVRFSGDNHSTYSPIYKKAKYEIKLSEQEIDEILKETIIFAEEFKQDLINNKNLT